jgi:hypothetical protein
MKYTTCIFFLTAGLAFFSCSSNDVSKENLVGRWKLSKKEGNNKKSIDLTNKSTVLILNLEENGYFTYYDSVTNPDWINTGVPRIQVQSHGQWTLENKTLVLSDSEQDKTERLVIEEISDNDMVTKNAQKKSEIFTVYGKQ